MKLMNPITVIALAAIMATTGFAATTSHKAHVTSKKAIVLICPVTGEKIASIKDAVGHSTYKGKTYYFCCSGCKPMFDANPAKYVK